jgi:hypothetical protein
MYTHRGPRVRVFRLRPLTELLAHCHLAPLAHHDYSERAIHRVVMELPLLAACLPPRQIAVDSPTGGCPPRSLRLAHIDMTRVMSPYWLM